MLHKLHLEQLLFLDIETVPEQKDFEALDDTKKELWDLKSRYKRGEEVTPKEFYDSAGIWAEFGIIICISVGYFRNKGADRHFRVTSYHGPEEKILKDFKALLVDHFSHPKYLLCAHNGKEFDFPYIARRMIVNGIALPAKLDLFGKKPWEVPHLDTMELWKFGDYKHYTSLKLMANILRIPSPKGDIDGSMVRDVYYKDRDIDRIIRYCEKDVITVAQVFLRLRNEGLLTEGEIVNI